MRSGRRQGQPWNITLAAVGGLLVAILIVGVVGLLVNRNLQQVTNRTIQYDIELEDEGDDLRAAVLDLRHYQRNIYFTGPSRNQVSNFEDAYAALQEETGELEQITTRIDVSPDAEDVRRMSEEYYGAFRPAIDLYETDREAFVEASDRALIQLEELEEAATILDELGEQRAEAALVRVDQAAMTARLVLLTVIAGLAVAGATLAYAVMRVVNELRRSYAEQQRAAEQLAAASKAKSDFIADVSHELRTPLTVLRGNAEVGIALDSDCAHSDILREIVKESKKMSSMVEDLLFLARSDSATLPLEESTILVAPFMAEVANRAEMFMQERGASFKVDLHGQGTLNADRGRIEQAILILIDNAAKYSPLESVVSLFSTVRSGELVIEVADQGPGIPEEDLPHIFERFYRVDKTRTRKRGGTGLGLSIARTIVEAHGGNIEAHSRVGEGTRMVIRLPLAESQDAQSGPGRTRNLTGERG